MRRVASVDVFSLAMEDTKDSLCLRLTPPLKWRNGSDHFGDKPLVSNFPKAWQEDGLGNKPCP